MPSVPVFLVIAVVASVACRSLPDPEEEGDSLFVLISENPASDTGKTKKWVDTFNFQGKTPFSIKIGRKEYELHYRKVRPGKYRIIDRIFENGKSKENLKIPLKKEFEIKPNSIYLFPLKIMDQVDIRGEFSTKWKKLDNNDRKKAAEGLEDYLDFQKWETKTCYGFGSCKPVFLKTIMKQLTEEKKQNANEMEEEREKTLLVFFPFKNIGAGNADYIKSLFSELITAGLSRQKKLSVVFGPKNMDDGIFAYAREKRADYLISGKYLLTDEKLIVHASLYDSKKEMVKTSILLTGRGGLSIYDSIDKMTDELLLKVTRELPWLGTSLEESRRLTEKAVISKRLERHHTIGINFLESLIYDRNPRGGYNGGMRYQGVGFGVGFTYEYTFKKSPFSLAVKVNPVFPRVSNERSSKIHIFELPILFGPQYSFYRRRSEAYLGLLTSFRYISPYPPENHSAAFTFGMDIDTGVKIYSYRKFSLPSSFFNFGTMISLFKCKYYDSAIREFPVEFLFYMGFGSRL